MIDHLSSTLEEENKQLKKQIALLLEQDHLKDEIVIQQSKMASMGEMINNIAHQWRQPLMEISTILMHLECKIKLQQTISNDDILDTISKSNQIIEFMSETIEDFRNFFAKNKNKEEFTVVEQVSSAINLMNNIFKQHNIKINIIIKQSAKIYGFKNEYKQVLLNILTNAKDIIISNNIKYGKINIILFEKDNNVILEIEDNGGGIDINPIDKVFEPFFTYKKQNGTGVGLFMSKLIIEHNMNGKLSVENRKEGACFQIVVPKL